MEEITVPEFSKDDFFTETPYEWLYQFSDNKFKLVQMKAQLKEMAHKERFTGFDSMWIAYRDQQSETGKFSLVTTNSTNFHNQELELLCGDYICDDDGITTYSRAANSEIIVCMHPIMPTKRLVNIDTAEEKMQIAFKKGRFWRTIVVDKAVIASAAKIIELSSYGVVVNSENAKALSSFLLNIEQLNYDEIPEQCSVGRLGWIGSHGFSPYVENLEFDGENSFKHIFNAVKQNGSREKWIEAMKDVRAQGFAGRLFLAASFASVILEPCGLLPFFLHAWGGTETGKTVGLMIAASVWGNPKIGEYITTFNSTAVAQELQASFLNSLPMCLDELQIQSSQGVRDFDKIIYMLTEGVGKTRGAKQGGLQKNTTWKNCIITNGEHPISNSSSGGGAVNRIIEFECTEKIYSDLVGLCSVITANYGFAGKEFVDFLQKEGSFEYVNQIQKQFFKELLNLDSTDKQAGSASALLAADKIATDLIFKDGNNLTVDEIKKLLTKKDDVDVNKRAYAYLMDVVSMNPNKFTANSFGEFQGEIWGCIEDGYIYIVKTAFNRILTEQGFNPTAFLSWAVRTEKAVNDGKGHNTKVKRIAGLGSGMVRCVCLKRTSEFNNDSFEDLDSEIIDIFSGNV